MRTRTLYDAVTVSNIPAGATMVAGYVDGRYQTVTELRRRFPHARIVVITVLGGSQAAHVVDVEQGDCTPATGAAWAKRRCAIGAHPTIYCSTSVRPAVERECARLGLKLRRDYEIWEAHYDGQQVIPAGAIAKQFTDHANGKSLDQSIVAGYWPGVDPKPTTVSAHAAAVAHRAHLHALAVLHRLHLAHAKK